MELVADYPLKFCVFLPFCSSFWPPQQILKRARAQDVDDAGDFSSSRKQLHCTPLLLFPLQTHVVVCITESPSVTVKVSLRTGLDIKPRTDGLEMYALAAAWVVSALSPAVHNLQCRCLLTRVRRFRVVPHYRTARFNSSQVACCALMLETSALSEFVLGIKKQNWQVAANTWRPCAGPED